MKYFKKVILENFQSHKYSELKFDNKLNVIVGPSDQGKSAIIRGIQWALFNEPSGDYFIRKGEKDCSVTLIFSDNTIIKRYRSKSKNLYYLYDANGKEKIFEGFGTNVPEEILNKINIKKIHLNGKQSNSINISNQLEGPFLLSEKTATRANAIGRLVGIHFVDDAITDTLKDIRNLNILKKNTENQLNNNIEELSKYDYLDKLQKKINKLESNKNRIITLENKVEKLKNLFTKYNNVNSSIKKTRNIVIKLSKINYVNDYIKDLNIKVKTYILINNRSKTMLENKKNICYNKNILSKIKNSDNIQLTIKKLEHKIKNRNILSLLSSKKECLDKNLNSNNKTLLKLNNIQLVNKNIVSIDKFYKRLTILKSLKDNIININKRITYGSQYINHFSKIYSIDIKLLSLEEKNNLLMNLIIVKNRNILLQAEIQKLEISLVKYKKQTKYLLLEYKNLLSKFEVCPLCLSKINQNTIKKIIDTYK